MKIGWHRIYWMRWRWLTVKMGIRNTEKTFHGKKKLSWQSRAVMKYIIEQEFDRKRFVDRLFKHHAKRTTVSKFSH